MLKKPKKFKVQKLKYLTSFVDVKFVMGFSEGYLSIDTILYGYLFSWILPITSKV